jgi:predicted porin
MGRQAHGDLTGAFGALSAGRQYSLGFNNLSTIDPFGTGFAGQTNNTDGKGNYMVDPSGVRLNNSVTYTTPSIAGLTASGEISFGEQTGNWEANRETGAALTYANGPAYAGFTFYDQGNANGNGAAKKNFLLGGTYDFGVVKVHALVQKVSGQPTGGAKLDSLSYMGGVTVPVAGGSVLASVVHKNDKTLANQDATQYGVGYLYPLSKRTSVYTAFGKINNQHGAAYLVGNATAQGTGNKAFDLGVVHNF